VPSEPSSPTTRPAAGPAAVALFRDTVELGWTGARARRALELADDVARVHRQQLLGESIALEPVSLEARARRS